MKDFKVILDALWIGFAKSISLINLLESVGLTITNTTDPGTSGFSELYRIQGKTAKTILNYFDIDSEMHGTGGKGTILEELDQLLFDIYTDCPDYEEFPKEYYEDLDRLLTGCKTINGLDEISQPYRQHRAIGIKSGKPVIGYLWNGADHAYIIPKENGVSYNGDAEKLTAHAVEVDKKTIAVDMLIADDNFTSLFEGDTVKIGNEEFILKLSDMAVLSRLTSLERKEKGLYLVKHNYEM